MGATVTTDVIVVLIEIVIIVDVSMVTVATVVIITVFLVGNFSCMILSFIHVSDVVTDVFIAMSKVTSVIIVGVVVTVQCEVEKK